MWGCSCYFVQPLHISLLLTLIPNHHQGAILYSLNSFFKLQQLPSLLPQTTLQLKMSLFFFSLSSFYRNTTPFPLNFLPKAVKTTHVLLGSVVSFSEVARSRAGDNYITQNAHCLPESSQLTTQCWLNTRLILGDRSVCVCVSAAACLNILHSSMAALVSTRYFYFLKSTTGSLLQGAVTCDLWEHEDMWSRVCSCSFFSVWLVNS